ncbi:MAG: fibrillarin-like rRNA/tRNA 2'-O-methyltransferase [Methanomicrobiaceae archaeon]|nr:fibrillarin-like rRNA/tRNA 2'-O-methyltransferase [Methanomicrobiaceae archaeon]
MIIIDGVLVSKGQGGVYGEKMMKGYRVWSPNRSKFAALAMIRPGTDLNPDLKVLYLGAANGTTVSHFADYVNCVYAVEFAPRPMQDLIEVSRRRTNIIPIMADAGNPREYAPFVESVDMVYQDVAQPNQAEIAIMNLPFLKKGGILILMLKTRSVDVTVSPKTVFLDTLKELEESGLEIEDACWLEPYHHDHACIICRKNS